MKFNKHVKIVQHMFDIRALWRSGLSVRVPRCQKLQMAKIIIVWH